MAGSQTINVYAAGSLRAAVTEAARAFEQSAKLTVKTEFGASGLLRERIEKGEPAHVFLSADTGHPKRLAEQGRAKGKLVVFARNELCGLARDGLDVTSATLLETMLDPKVRLGTSTPKADPSGDYAFELFAKAETRRAGARAILEGKALQLTGGPTSERAPEGKNLYGWVMSSGKADLFLTYCTNAVLAKNEVPALKIIAVPPGLAVGAEYGLVVLNAAPEQAEAFARFVTGAQGQAILAKYGFGAGDPDPK